MFVCLFVCFCFCLFLFLFLLVCFCLFVYAFVRSQPLCERKNKRTKKHINKTFTGPSRDFLGILLMCFLSPVRNDPKKIHKQNFATHPVPGQSPNLMFMCFLFPTLSKLHGLAYSRGTDRSIALCKKEFRFVLALACIRTGLNSPKNLAEYLENIWKRIPQKYFLRSRECEYRPRPYSHKTQFPGNVSACVSFVLGGACVGGEKRLESASEQVLTG